jgi:hypothetical protein
MAEMQNCAISQSRISCNYSPVIPAKAGIHLGASIDHHPDGFSLSLERRQDHPDGFLLSQE